MATDLNALLGLDPTDPRVVEIEDDRADYRGLVESLVDQRRRAGLTQSQIAEHMETSQSVVSAFENAVTDARFSTVQRYARAIGTRIRWMYASPSQRYVETFQVPVAPDSAVDVFYRAATG